MKDRLLAMPNQTLLLFGAVAAVAFYFFIGDHGPIESRIKTLRNDIKLSQEKLNQTTDKTQNKTKFQDEVGQVAETVRLAMELLPKEFDGQDLLKKIYSEARNSGVQLTKYKPKDPVSKDFYEELPMEIEVKGSYSQMVLFLSYISKIPRIINIKNVELGEPVIGDGLPRLTLKGILLTYRYKEGK